MKKTLVAIAALAATGAFAQSSVVLSGNLDFAASNSTGTQAIAVGKTVATTTGTSSTSVIRITAVEDMGAGTKATVSYGLDPRPLANDSLSTTNNTQAAGISSTTTQGAAVATGLARDAVFVGLEGAYGNVRLGSPNSLGLEVQGNSSPLGTGAGSGYTGLASSTMINSVVNTRYNRSLRYDTPTMSGVTASILFAPGEDVAAATPSTTTGGTSTALPIPNARKTTELGLKYVNGPLTASVAQIKQADQTNKTGYFSGSQTSASAETSATIYGVSYAIGATTVYVGGNTGDRLAVKSSSDGSKVESKGTRVAVKHTMGKVDLIAQQTTQKTTGASADYEAKVTGLGADYNFSKTTATYFRYQKADSGAAYATTAATGTGALKTVSVGLRKSF
jgi:predicted porin